MLKRRNFSFQEIRESNGLVVAYYQNEYCIYVIKGVLYLRDLKEYA